MSQPLFLIPGDHVTYEGRTFIIVGSYAHIYPNMVNATDLFSRDFHQYALLDPNIRPKQIFTWIRRERLSKVFRADPDFAWNDDFMMTRYIYESILERCQTHGGFRSNESIGSFGGKHRLGLTTKVLFTRPTEDGSRLTSGYIIGRYGEMINNEEKTLSYEIRYGRNDCCKIKVDAGLVIPDDIDELDAIKEYKQ